MQNGHRRFCPGTAETWHGSVPHRRYHDDLQTEPVPWHWHEELEVLVVSEGTILATAAGEKYRLEKGEGLFINAGVLHGDWPLNAGPCRRTAWCSTRGWWAAAGQRFLAEIFAAAADRPQPAPCAVLRPGVEWQREAMNQMERAFRAVVNEQPGYESRPARRCRKCCSSWWATPRSAGAAEKSPRSADRIKTMLQFIQEHYAEDVSVEQIAASAAISPSECLRCFHDMIGTTPNQLPEGPAHPACR